MTRWFLFWTFLVMVGSSVSVFAQNLLKFEGGFYDRGDSFVMEVDFDKEPVVIKWDGYVRPLAAMNIDREGGKVQAKRVQFSLKLTDDEAAIFRGIWKGFGSCDPGELTSIGSGLSVRASTIFDGKARDSFFYFVPPHDDFLALEAKSFPTYFQLSIAGNGIKKETRDRFFRVAKTFADRIDGYESAMTHLEKSNENGEKPDWARIWKWVEWPSKRKAVDPNRAPVSSVEVSGVLSALANPEYSKLVFGKEKGTSQKPVIFRINGIVTMREFRWGGHDSMLPIFLNNPSVNWAVLPEEIKSLVEDFIGIQPLHWMHGKETSDHVLFNFPKGTKEGAKRSEFIDQSQLVDFLLGLKPDEKGSAKVNFQMAKIYQIGVEWDGKKAGKKTAVLIKNGDVGNVIELEKKNGKWTVTSSHDSDQWFEKWDDTPITPPFDLK